MHTRYYFRFWTCPFVRNPWLRDCKTWLVARNRQIWYSFRRKDGGPMNFSENLTRTRKSLGMSQEDLAGRIGVSRQAVSKWETGDAAPDLIKLLALADALDISLDALCGRTAAPLPASPPAEPAAKQRRLWPALCAALALCLILTCGALWQLWSQRNVVPAETAQTASTLPDTFTVSAENFSYSGGCLNYTFVPSAVGEGYTYQITFAGTDLAPQTFDVECVGGVCSGWARLSEYDTYTVSVVVSDGAGSRAAAVARDLHFREGSASWVPLSEIS